MFRTELSILKAPFSISHTSRIMTLGSCFSDEIGRYFSHYKFNTLVNPYGVIFNPLSLFRLITKTIDLKSPAKDSYVVSEGLYKHLDFHSNFSATSLSKLEERIVSTTHQTHNFLKKADILVVTLGTAVAYEYLKTSSIVANCHKIPQSEFKQSVITTDSIRAAFDDLVVKMRAFNRNLKIIFTVSPVRHIKDTLETNSVSKATLRTSCNDLVGEFSNVTYFPSYEIMLDDLRDYRFYKADMLHPNRTAIEYIWSKFSEAYFSERTQVLIEKWKKIRKAIDHKPLGTNSEAHQRFVYETISKVEGFSTMFDVSEELNSLREQLK
ncbi:MAG: GSCFA domain-containing protein [Bacteroidota bacterium]